MSEHPQIDGAEFRQVLGNYPTGVTVVTANDDGACGMVIGSFGSVSLDPPLVQFMPATASRSWERISRSGAYCVNVLGLDQLSLCNSFFDKDNDPFDGFEWRQGVTGSPVIDGCLAHIDCEIDAVHEAGDHYIVVGRVVDMALGSNSNGPLVFFRGGYGDFAPLESD
ncbi:MAG: flavin reductase family protein [Acidimicrobiales bacterium]